MLAYSSLLTNIQRNKDLLISIVLNGIVMCICFELLTLTPDCMILMKLCMKLSVDPTGRFY